MIDNTKETRVMQLQSYLLFLIPFLIGFLGLILMTLGYGYGMQDVTIIGIITSLGGFTMFILVVKGDVTSH